MAQRTVLYERHRDAGARFVEFAGWEMPLLYTGILSEHRAVRESVGVFDVSHMGKIFVEGSGAAPLLSRLSSNDVPAPGRARYTHLLHPDGTILDDVIVTCLTSTRFFVVCNAGPRTSVVAWLESFDAPDTTVHDATTDVVCIAIQGPRASDALRRIASSGVDRLHPFHGAVLDVGEDAGHSPMAHRPHEIEGWGPGSPQPLVTRTGYTGELGFELFPRAADGLRFWDALLSLDEPRPLPIGLGARDTLRLEKGFLLSGQDFDGRQTPLEVGCEWVVRWDHAFLGREALEAQRRAGAYRRLVGLRMEDAAIPRHGCIVYQGTEVIGQVTSGTMSPSLHVGIALASVGPAVSQPGTRIDVDVRGVRHSARVVAPPFL